MRQGKGKRGTCCFFVSHKGSSPARKDGEKELGTREDAVQYFPIQIYSETSHSVLLSHISGNQTCEKFLCPSRFKCSTVPSFTQKNKKDVRILSEPSLLAFERLPLRCGATCQLSRIKITSRVTRYSMILPSSTLHRISLTFNPVIPRKVREALLKPIIIASSKLLVEPATTSVILATLPSDLITASLR